MGSVYGRLELLLVVVDDDGSFDDAENARNDGGEKNVGKDDDVALPIGPATTFENDQKHTKYLNKYWNKNGINPRAIIKMKIGTLNFAKCRHPGRILSSKASSEISVIGTEGRDIKKK